MTHDHDGSSAARQRGGGSGWCRPPLPHYQLAHALVWLRQRWHGSWKRRKMILKYVKPMHHCEGESRGQRGILSDTKIQWSANRSNYICEAYIMVFVSAKNYNDSSLSRWIYSVMIFLKSKRTNKNTLTYLTTNDHLTKEWHNMVTCEQWYNTTLRLVRVCYGYAFGLLEITGIRFVE